MSRLSSICADSIEWHLACELWMFRLLVNGNAWKAASFGTFTASHCYTRGESSLAYSMCCIDKFLEKLDFLNDIAQNKNPSQTCIDTLKYCRNADLKNIPSDGELIEDLVSALNACEKRAANQKTTDLFEGLLKKNLELIEKIFAFDRDELMCLAFIVCVKKSQLLRSIVNLYSYAEKGIHLITDVIACACNIPTPRVQSLLQTNSRLFSTVLTFNENDYEIFEDFEDFFSINSAISGAHSILLGEKEILQSCLDINKKAELTLSDFEHIPEVQTILLPYLSHALEVNRKGVNILLYGAPGTGKTQLSRVIGQALSVDFYEVNSPSKSEDNKNPTRLDSWKIAVSLLRTHSDTLLIVDEAEDIFSSDIAWDSRAKTAIRSNKALINNLLETNAIPTIWLTNSLQAMDASMIRRFDLVLEIPQPTTAQRRKIIDKLSNRSLSAELSIKLSKTEDLSPGIVSRVVKVADAIAPTCGKLRDDTVESLVNNVLRAQGKRLPKKSIAQQQSVYSLEFVNTDVDLDALVGGIERSRCARLCLYGAPGTGKSAYAAWLAEKLDKPLIVKNASDLLDCYVGGTEQNIAQMFRQAKAEDAVLLLDEADSFLQDRTKSQQSWEVTQVNEMLTQMVEFDGVFIATTNLIETLDAASLRRFDLKVQFKALTGNQAQKLFLRYVTVLKIENSLSADILEKVKMLSGVTAGDFATVMRQSHFHPVTSAMDFLRKLSAECQIKKDNAARIGFY